MNNHPIPETDAADLTAIEERTAQTRAAGDRLTAVQDILKERRHQIAQGHTPRGDHLLGLGILSRAALACIAVADDRGIEGDVVAAYYWPFDYLGRPKSDVGRRRLLIKAAALLLAELEALPYTAAMPTDNPAVLFLTMGKGGE